MLLSLRLLWLPRRERRRRLLLVQAAAVAVAVAVAAEVDRVPQLAVVHRPQVAAEVRVAVVVAAHKPRQALPYRHYRRQGLEVAADRAAAAAVVEMAPANP